MANGALTELISAYWVMVKKGWGSAQNRHVPETLNHMGRRGFFLPLIDSVA